MKKFTAILLSVLMLFTVLPLTVFAETKYVNNFEELQAALANDNVDTIIVKSNIEVRSSVEINLNGKTVTTENGSLKELKLYGGGKIYGGGVLSLEIPYCSFVRFYNVTLNGNITSKSVLLFYKVTLNGNITAEGDTRLEYSEITGNIVNDCRTMKITDCTVKGNINNNKGLIISGIKIEGNVINDGTLEIGGGTFSSGQDGTYKIINNGTIDLSSAYIDIINNTSGAVLNFEGGEVGTLSNSGVVNMSGGKIVNGKISSNETGTFTISDGHYGYYGYSMTADANTTISGGIFTSPVSTGGIVSGGLFYNTLTFSGNGKIDGLTVTYINNGSQYAVNVLQSGNKATKPDDPLKDTSGVTVWYTDEACTSVYDFNAPVTGNITLYGQKDTQGPSITGIENNKTYCMYESLSFNVKDNDSVAYVTINGTKVAPNSDGSYKFTKDLYQDGSNVTVAAVDASGNTTTLTVTLYKNHDYIWCSENGQYWQGCKRINCDYASDKKAIPTIEINGADKVCKTQDYTFSFTLSTGLSLSKVCYEFNSTSENSEVLSNGSIYTGTIKSDKFSAGDNELTVTVYAENSDGYTVTATKTVQVLAEHEGGTATCNEFAKCTVCGKTYGDKDIDNHVNLKQFPEKAATVDEEGNIEYWYCDGCNKYFGDENGTNEIEQENIVIKKLEPDDSDDDSSGGVRMFYWLKWLLEFLNKLMTKMFNVLGWAY